MLVFLESPMTTTALLAPAPSPGIPQLSGNPLALVRQMRRDPLALMQRASRECGDLAAMRIGPTRVLALSHPRHVEPLLVSGASVWTKQTRGQAVLRLILGRGLLTAEGEEWRRNRRIANPAFARRAIGGFAQTMHRATLDLAADWQGRSGPQDLARDMNHLALRIAGETLFGADVDSARQVVSHGLDVVLGDFLRLTTLPWPWMARLPTPRNRRLWRALGQLDRVVNGIVAARRQVEEQPPDLLGMLMSAVDEDGQGLSDRQLRDEVLTMLLAGHETTANALAWTLYLLGRHPQAQERVAEEAAGLGEGIPDPAKLSFTRAVLNESMRLYPPAWITSRAASEDTELDGQPVARGTFAFLSPYVLHRHPEIWPDPEAFLPERWVEERPLGVDERPVPKDAFMPFGAGPRKCIGSHFAMMEATIVLATLLWGFRLSLVPGHEVRPQASITLRPEGGVVMSLRRR